MSKKKEKKDVEKPKKKTPVSAARTEKSGQDDAGFYLLKTRALEEQLERWAYSWRVLTFSLKCTSIGLLYAIIKVICKTFVPL